MTKLSPQQRGVVDALFGGHTTRKQIAQYIGVKQSTLRVHMAALFQKTNSTNVVELVFWALRNGWQLPQGAGDD